MHKTIISDTSCLILLDKINELEILHQLFGFVTTTPEIAAEFGRPLPSWINIQETANKQYQTFIEASVDKGEASAIALAVELQNCLLIVDDLKGRKLAQQLGLNIIGTIGVLVDAKISGIIPSITPILLKIKGTDFRITDALEEIILKKTCE